MGIRDAIGRSTYLTVMVIAFGLWASVIAVRTFNTIEGAWLGTSDVAVGGFVGQAVGSGIVGIVVLVASVGLLLVMFGELEESEPAPTPWPPEEE